MDIAVDVRRFADLRTVAACGIAHVFVAVKCLRRIYLVVTQVRAERELCALKRGILQLVEGKRNE